MTPYRSSGRAPILGVILLLLLTVIGGVAIGAVAYFISKFIYLIVLFPLVMIALGGGIISFAVKRGKIRSRPITLIFGVLMAVLIYGSFRIGEYLGFQEDLYNMAVEEVGSDNFSRDDLIQFMDDQLEEETGDTGFIGFTKYSAQQGIDISYRSTDIHLDEKATWI
ncbi:MAG TPA: hypothetical protein VHL11_06310, partial [Phototrophicaceae bacterium]|nr:hypothetical protein [Phototrophicaceae bacterium]